MLRLNLPRRRKVGMLLANMAPVLRITLEGQDGFPTLRLEGRISGPWVGELRRVAHDSLIRAHSLTLDLSEVDFVDGSGAALLGELMGAGIGLRGCSGFVFELLRGIRPRASSGPAANPMRGVAWRP